MAKRVSFLRGNARISANPYIRIAAGEPAEPAPGRMARNASPAARQLAQVKARHASLYGYRGQRVPMADK